MKPVESLINAVLDPFRLHPLVAPYLGCSRDSPPLRFLHQQELLALLAPRLPVRAFIGDEIGLGKTVSAIAVAKCLWEHGRARRILLILPRVLIFQWRKELERMGVPPAKIRSLERESIPELMKKGFPEGYYLASMDLIKREGHIRKVETAPWDLIIVDEAHRLGFKTKRYKNLGHKLLEAVPERNVLFLSATPHRGNPKDYLARLSLIDPSLLLGWHLDSTTFYGLTHGAIMFRRTKEDVNSVYEGRSIFPPATFYACFVRASAEEADFVERTVVFLRSKLVELSGKSGLAALLKVLIFKRASSSPYALLTTAQRMIAKRATGDLEAAERLAKAVGPVLGIGYEDYVLEEEPDGILNEFLEQASPLLTEQDVEELRGIIQTAQAIVESGGDSKLRALQSLLEGFTSEGLKVVVFTEYKDTLKYICSFLRKNRPEWRLLTLSSEEAGDPEEFRRVREAFERSPDARILIATDVVAEGVNMQVANILINYEVPWSIVKLEQRVGRVWRLGQTRDVEVYTFFMNNSADRAALNKIYEKLMNLRRSGIGTRPIIGEELRLFADASEIPGYPQGIPQAKQRKRLKMSEYTLINEFLERGEMGLEAIVEDFLKARRGLMQELSSKGVLYRPKTRDEVERILSTFGFGDDVFGPFTELLEACAPFLGVSLKRKEDRLLASIGGGMPFEVRTIDDVFSLLSPRPGEPAVLIALGEPEERFVIAVASVKAKNRLIYVEPVMFSLESGAIYRGAELLRKVSELASKLMGRVEEPLPEVPIGLQAAVVDVVRSSLREALSPLEAYRGRLSQLDWRNPDSWAGLGDVVVEVEPKVLVKVVRGGKEGETPDESIKKDVERKAMEFAMSYERGQGRIPIDVSASEHYDVKSIDPSTGEARYIEVKGHHGPVAGAELTDDEAEFAKQKGSACWLYIVYDIGSGSPKLLTFRDPMSSLAWRLIEKVERRYVWP